MIKNEAIDDNLISLLSHHRPDIEKIKDLLKSGANVNTVDRDGCTPIMYASMLFGQQIIFETLLNYNPNLDFQNKDGMTALMFSAIEGNEWITYYLLKKGAGVNITDQLGNTAIAYAASNGHYFIVNMLINAGAKTDIQNKNKEKPIDLATRDTELIETPKSIRLVSETSFESRIFKLKASSREKNNIVRMLKNNKPKRHKDGILSNFFDSMKPKWKSKNFDRRMLAVKESDIDLLRKIVYREHDINIRAAALSKLYNIKKAALKYCRNANNYFINKNYDATIIHASESVRAYNYYSKPYMLRGESSFFKGYDTQGEGEIITQEDLSLFVDAKWDYKKLLSFKYENHILEYDFDSEEVVIGSLDINTGTVYSRLAMCHYFLNDNDNVLDPQILDYMNKAEEFCPDDIIIIIQKGQYLLSLNLYEQALNQFNKVLALDNNNALAIDLINQIKHRKDQS